MPYYFVVKPKCPNCKSLEVHAHCENGKCGWVVCTKCRFTFNNKERGFQWQDS